MELEKLYFFTASILNWKQLLAREKYKKLIIQSLSFLSQKEKINVYGFVIMPNHIHLIWEMIELNGKESPHASFLKFTSHEIQKDLRRSHPNILEDFKVQSEIRNYQFWQRDSLPIELYSPEVIFQKLNYIHNNPCQGKWLLSNSPLEYEFSSAAFYESGKNDFGFLKHIGERL